MFLIFAGTLSVGNVVCASALRTVASAAEVDEELRQMFRVMARR